VPVRAQSRSDATTGLIRRRAPERHLDEICGTHPWLKFNLRAHHIQAQTQQRRFAEAATFYDRLDELVTRHRLNDRVADPLSMPHSASE
jgi:hypothetical protein